MGCRRVRGAPAAYYLVRARGPAAVLPPSSSQLGLGVWTVRELGEVVSARGGVEGESYPASGPTGSATPHVDIRRLPPPSPHSPPPMRLVGASRPCRRTPPRRERQSPQTESRVWPPSLAQGLSPPALPASGLRPHSWPRALGCQLPRPPQPEQVAPQQACSLVLGRC